MNMRRHDRAILDEARIDEIILSCHCCRLGFADGGECYIVPLSFGFRHGQARVFYFHSAKEGRKVDLARRLGRAVFELDGGYQLHEADTPCKYSCAFESVMGAGRVEEIIDPAEKLDALGCILAHTAGRDDAWAFPAKAADSVAVFKLTVDEISCKVHA